MKRLVLLVFAFGSVVLLSSCTTRNIAQTDASPVSVPSQPVSGSAPAPFLWPLVFTNGTATFTVFVPQIDSWDGHRIIARSAVSVLPVGLPQAVYGALSFTAISLVDKSSGAATLADVKITSVDFPSAPGQIKDDLAWLQQEFPKCVQPLPLYRLQASLTLPERPPRANSLNNNPPKIIIATRPAVLVFIDGPPAWRSVADTGLKCVINTRVLLLKDSVQQHYLHLFDGYLQASRLDGAWTVASHAPAGAGTAEKLAVESGWVDLLAGEPDATTHALPSLSASPTPDVFVVTQPSELITFKGPPEFVPVPDTDLLYADNTSGNVFKLLADQANYVLISGRWYRAPSLDGPWQFVPGNLLPPDFARIPDTCPKENVKASVPGTPQAEEALLANSIPQSAAIARTLQMQDPQMDGPMRLAPIKGTPLYYVVNSATPAIEVGPQSWFACQGAVWFCSTSVHGSWTVAASVPPVIYSIPTTSPLHYLTYVYVFGSTPDTVFEGYTPGYMGTEVAEDGTVVYGTGYDYPPWIGDDWYSPPMTWGWGFDDCWTPWWGWGFDCGFGWCGCCPPFACWGGFRHWHDHDGGGWRGHGHDGFAHTGGDLYRHPGLSGGEGRQGEFAGNGFNAQGRQGWPGDYGHAYNSRTGQLAAGEQARVQNVSGGSWQSANRPNDSFGAAHDGNGLIASPRSGGWFHRGGGFFRSGGRGGGGGGSHGGGGGGHR
jgi:hypothetical protein